MKDKKLGVVISMSCIQSFAATPFQFFLKKMVGKKWKFGVT